MVGWSPVSTARAGLVLEVAGSADLGLVGCLFLNIDGEVNTVHQLPSAEQEALASRGPDPGP